MLLCADMAAAKDLWLSWLVEPTLPQRLLMDDTRLQQVILNLLSNAIKVSLPIDFSASCASFAQPDKFRLSLLSCLLSVVSVYSHWRSRADCQWAPASCKAAAAFQVDAFGFWNHWILGIACTH